MEIFVAIRVHQKAIELMPHLFSKETRAYHGAHWVGYKIKNITREEQLMLKLTFGSAVSMHAATRASLLG